MSFSIYFVVGWSKFRGKEKKEEPLLPAQWDSSFGLFAIDEGSIKCNEILLQIHDGLFFFFFLIETWVKLGFQNKNKDSLGIILKITNGNITNHICVFASQLQEVSNMKMQESFIFEKATFGQHAMAIIYQTCILGFGLGSTHFGF